MAELYLYRAYVAYLQGDASSLRFGLDLAERAVVMLGNTLWKFACTETLELAARLHLALGHTGQALLRSEQCVRVAGSLPMPQ